MKKNLKIIIALVFTLGITQVIAAEPNFLAAKQTKSEVKKLLKEIEQTCTQIKVAKKSLKKDEWKMLNSLMLPPLIEAYKSFYQLEYGKTVADSDLEQDAVILCDKSYELAKTF